LIIQEYFCIRFTCMKKILFSLLSFLLCHSTHMNASHIFGGDIGYKHISGNTYEVYLNLYGDCSGVSFPNLITSVPNIEVYNGLSPIGNFNVLSYGISGQNITPVCAADALNTTCNGGTIPGVAEFKFKALYTLPSNSANWRFVFNANLGSSNLAGRSNTISNISQTQTSLMRLEATLNNTVGPNTSANFTSLPTPFFCINQPQQYNQGAIDTDGDVLSFDLMDGLDTVGTVTYISPYSAVNPLATASGTFNFSNINGQMAFTPNLSSQFLVVNKVTEKRNGITVGTSMREMTFVILGSCSNLSPLNLAISNPNTGTVDANGQLRVCKAPNQISFEVNATDPNLSNLSLTYTGLPSGAIVNVLNNNTPTPKLLFNWTFPSLPAFGNYTFFVTFQNEACPISSKFTVAYTIIIEDPIIANTTSISESCNPGGDAQIIVSANSPNTGLQYSLDSINFINSGILSNLTSGSYDVFIKDANGCTRKITQIINPPTPPIITNVIVKDISCSGDADGSLTVVYQPTTGSYQFTLLPNNITNNNGIFNNLSAGIFTIVIQDNKNCSDTIQTNLSNPALFEFNNVQAFDLSCGQVNGRIIAQTNILANTNFSLNNGLQSNTTGVFTNLSQGVYTVTATSSNGCTTQTIITIDVDLNDFEIYTWKENLPCIGRGNEGRAFVVVQGGKPPYTFLWNTTPPNNTDTIKDLYYGKYEILVTDIQGCELRRTVEIESGSCCENVFIPNAFSPNNDGVNDAFSLRTSTGLRIKQFEIYNRWGQKVWTGRDQREGWNGKLDGEEAKVDTYFFVLRYTCLSNGEDYLRKGEITLVR